jgi:hypothetical protein
MSRCSPVIEPARKVRPDVAAIISVIRVDE